MYLNGAQTVPLLEVVHGEIIHTAVELLIKRDMRLITVVTMLDLGVLELIKFQSIKKRKAAIIFEAILIKRSIKAH